MNYKTIPILLAFLCMGFIDGVGVFVGLAESRFQLSHFVAQLIPFVGFIMFGVLSVPMGLLQDRTTKKLILLVGLIVALTGAAISFSGLGQYVWFLATVMLLGAGATILQVAGNPIMRDVSGPEKYSRNLSIGQSVKAIGSLSGPLVPVLAATIWHGMDWQILFPIYAATLLLTVILVALTKIQEHRDSGVQQASLASCLALLGNGYVLTMVLAIFVYVGTEVCISSGVGIYLKEFSQEGSLHFDKNTLGMLANALFIFLLLLGRSLGSVVLNWISAKPFLVVTVLVTILGLFGLMLAPNQNVAIAGIVLAGLGCANIFPLVFSITVNALPERSNEISGLMVTAIVGGAFLPPLMGLLADQTSVKTGFLVPLACCVYLLYAGLASLKVRPAVQR
jgi:fucose permease